MSALAPVDGGPPSRLAADAGAALQSLTLNACHR
jgi:hypothetical protein